MAFWKVLAVAKHAVNYCPGCQQYFEISKSYRAPWVQAGFGAEVCSPASRTGGSHHPLPPTADGTELQMYFRGIWGEVWASTRCGAAGLMWVPPIGCPSTAPRLPGAEPSSSPPPSPHSAQHWAGDTAMVLWGSKAQSFVKATQTLLPPPAPTPAMGSSSSAEG